MELPINHIICGDCIETMKTFPSESIDLIVTSPPYYNLKRYSNWSSIDDYYKDIEKSFRQCFRILRDNRFACVVVGQFTSREKSYYIPAKIVQIFESIGLKYKREHIWMKPLGTQGIWNRGTTAFLKKPYPRNTMINIHHEHVLIFQKGNELDIFYKRNPLTQEEVKKYCWSVWEIPVSKVKNHPAPFPEEIPKRLIKMYSYENEVVLDPFVGVGTTCATAKKLKRKWIGIDINAKYVEMAKARLSSISERLTEFLAVKEN